MSVPARLDEWEIPGFAGEALKVRLAVKWPSKDRPAGNFIAAR